MSMPKTKGGAAYRACGGNSCGNTLHNLRTGGNACFCAVLRHRQKPFGRRFDPCYHDPAHGNAYHTGKLKDRPRQLQRGRACVGCGKVAYDTDGSSALGGGRYSHRLYSVNRTDSGRKRGSAFTSGMANEMLNIFQAVSPGNAGSTLTVALYMYAKERGISTRRLP